MKKVKNILGGAAFSIHRLTKKSYTAGLVVMGAMMVTVLMLGTNGIATHHHYLELNSWTEASEEDSEMESITETAPAVTTFTLDLETLSHNASDDPLSSEATDIQVALETMTFLSQGMEEMQGDEVVALELAPTLYTDQDYQALLQIVEAEATGEDVVGKIMVANVVLNRVSSKRFPDSIYDVIHQKDKGLYQFSPLYDGRYYSVTVTETTVTAVERALSGESYAANALFFMARSLASEGAATWFDRNLKRVAQHGAHEFFSY